MTTVAFKRQSLKGIKINADKGRRTERLYGNATPATKATLAKILEARGISFSDWVEEMAAESGYELAEAEAFENRSGNITLEPAK